MHAIDRACFPAGIAYSRAQLRSLLEHPSSLSTIAEEGGRIQGFIILRPLGRRSGADTITVLHLLTIDVAVEGRRRGTGSLLMRWALAQAERIRARVFALEASVENLPAQAFYAQFGFQAVGTIPGYYPGGLDAVSMELVLRP